MSRGPAPFLFALALAVTTGCAATGGANTTTTSYQTVLEASGRDTYDSALTLAADKPSYRRGETIAVSLRNRGSVTYGRDIDGCQQPVSVWLRDAAGATYFLRSGERRECASRDPIEPGAAATLAEFDSALVWLDRTESDRLYRLPAPLPAGRYTVHASLPVGELITNIEVR